jgi:phosphoglycerate dehydrogenase-like enzyme
MQSHLDKLSGVEFILMTPDRKYLLNGKDIPLVEVKAEAGWLNNDLFQSQGAIGGYIGGLMASPNLKWIQSSAAGYEHPIFGEFIKKGAILSTNHSQSVGISEYVLATVLDHFQRGPERRQSQAESKWNRLKFREIMKSNWLIIGFGGIGQDVAKRARAFGARITGVRRSKGTHEFADRMIGIDEIAEHMPNADVVVLCIPLSKATANLADTKFLAAMKKGAVLVNVGRGGLVDEDALRGALDKGTPEFAILDVFKTEPLPSDSWIYKHPRIFMTPHASPDGTGLEERGGEVFVENLRRYLAGEPLNNLADPKEVLGE